MKYYVVIIYFLLLGISSASSASKRNCKDLFKFGKDKYSGFFELSRQEKEGEDYRVRLLNRKHPITIIAPHGGLIEPGTSHVAQSLAGLHYNYYSFEGIKASNNFSLHITSTRFDEPAALNLVRSSKLTIAVHSFSATSKEIVEVGGRNLPLAEKISASLIESGIKTQFPAQIFKGVSPRNIVNRSKEEGVQLEISTLLMERLLSDQKLYDLFIRSIKKVLAEYEKGLN